MAPGRRLRRALAHAVVATSIAAGAAAWTAAPRAVHADATFDQVLFSLINQDRAANGLPALRWNAQLSSLGESAPYGGCGFTVLGRAQDMIQRNYFAHTICGTQNVFNVMQADHVGYSSAGENIGWESGYTDPTQAAQYLNTEFMNSADHRANILNASFTDVGTGSWATAPGQVWTGGGGSFSNVFMASEEFAGFSSAPAPAPSNVPTVVGGSGPGYWLVGGDGGVFAFATPGYYGSLGGVRLARPVVGATATVDHNGYWLVAADGGIFTFGDARGYGSTGNVRLKKPIVGMAVTASGNGYWLVARDGGIFPFGDAVYHSYGSTGGIRLNQPIVGMARTTSGNGYWLVAADGGIFPFGDARYHSYGSTGNIRLNQPIAGMARTASGNGYWLVARDGGIFPFGDAVYHSYGSTGGMRLNRPIVSMTPTPDGNGYWLVAADGGVFPFGDAPYHGSTGSIRLASPVVALTS
jgi:uncharacterized protein YkwD